MGHKTTTRTLSKNEAKLILGLEWKQQKVVTLDEVRKTLRASREYAKYMVHRLTKKGWLERLRSGTYRVIPAERGPEGVGDTNPYMASAVIKAQHFYSFGTACTHHGFTEQVFMEMYVACRERRRVEDIGGKRHIFAYTPEPRFFGFEIVSILGQQVNMATRERAVLDAVSRPDLAGGIGEVSGIIRKASRKLSWGTLIEFLKRWNESALVQRLGYLLDLHGARFPKEELLKLLNLSGRVFLGSRPQWGTAGHVALPWRIVENVPMNVLKEGPG